jgi:hypothetical protein
VVRRTRVRGDQPASGGVIGAPHHDALYVAWVERVVGRIASPVFGADGRRSAGAGARSHCRGRWNERERLCAGAVNMCAWLQTHLAPWEDRRLVLWAAARSAH